ncbi:hypothetical protein [Amycolatopsis sp. CA-230715]|uniref:hypothetical protein n=1 Tax=Amycolatopsis sp. CA-230715 TaxID=2745196 RepID=UPI001C0224C1|nr:hypothetical protein [Amycolatopsis sp. CA-230715]QWF76632.1 hypothetical protein HUW46_00008 [Amycolatopsis sp. CA-230715]
MFYIRYGQDGPTYRVLETDDPVEFRNRVVANLAHGAFWIDVQQYGRGNDLTRVSLLISPGIPLSVHEVPPH